jgi:hypothetical protein
MPRDSPLSATRFTVAALATWRLTHLLASEDGPGAVVARVRARLGTGWMGELADCFQCLSLWVAAPLTPFVARERGNVVAVWLALSGAACQLESLLGKPESEMIDLPQSTEEEATDGMLWTAARGHGGSPAGNG